MMKREGGKWGGREGQRDGKRRKKKRVEKREGEVRGGERWESGGGAQVVNNAWSGPWHLRYSGTV